MTENKPLWGKEDLVALAPQGANEVRWLRVVHQLTQCMLSAQVALETLKEIDSLPENETEWSAASDYLPGLRKLLLHIMEYQIQACSYLADTDMPERILREEV